MNSASRRTLVMFSLLFAGEAIFTLPFHIARYFRPTFVDVLGITQTELGELFSIYGLVAMFAYIVGGGLADRFSPRDLLSVSLVATAGSGLFLVTIPSFEQLRWLFAFWGVSTVLAFWSALLRATREWGGPTKQGSAFGLLDGGRGAMAAVMAAIALAIIAQLLPTSNVTLEDRTIALRSTILFYATCTLIAAGFVWFVVPDQDTKSQKTPSTSSKSGRLRQVMQQPVIWLHAVVILTAYSAYKGFDFFSQFVHDVWGWSDVESARLSTTAAWMRPVAAIAAGFLADRVQSSRVIIVAFFLTAIAYAALPWIPPQHGIGWLLWTNVLTICLGIFALRGIYFALLEEGQIPRSVTGTAIGVVSFLGFVPEIYIYYVGGRLIDNWSGGPTGYRVFFAFVAVGCLIGMIAAATMRRRVEAQTGRVQSSIE